MGSRAISFKAPQVLIKYINDTARRLGKSRSEVIRDALLLYIMLMKRCIELRNEEVIYDEAWDRLYSVHA